MSLTRSGEALYPVIRQVLSADEALTQTVGELKGVQRGKVRIGAFNSVCVAWLPQLVAEYRVKYPGVEIEIDQGTYDDVIEWIKTGVVDLGFSVYGVHARSGGASAVSRQADVRRAARV